MASRKRRNTEVTAPRTDAELLGVSEVMAQLISLTDEERATLVGIDADIAAAEEAQRKARSRVAALKRQRKSCVTSIKASRFDDMVTNYENNPSEGGEQ